MTNNGEWVKPAVPLAGGGGKNGTRHNPVNKQLRGGGRQNIYLIVHSQLSVVYSVH